MDTACIEKIMKDERWFTGHISISCDKDQKFSIQLTMDDEIIYKSRGNSSILVAITSLESYLDAWMEGIR